MGLTASHWVFLAVTITMLFAMAVRRGVIILAMVGIVLLALLSPHSGATPVDHAIFAAQAMFRAAIIGGSRLFDTILLVGFMGALLHLLRQEGIDRLMLAPFARVMRGPNSAFAALAAASLACSLFFWPTPSALLVGALLVPAALRAGLPPIAAGMALSMAGHGMALSADPVIQAAARITGAPGGVPVSAILPVAMLLGGVLGVVALAFAVLRLKRAGDDAAIVLAPPLDAVPPSTARQRLLAVIVPLLLAGAALLVAVSPASMVDSGAGVALFGGMAVVLLILTCSVLHGVSAFDSIVEMMGEGFHLVIRVFAPVVPVLGFFMLGDAASAHDILGEGTPGYIAGIAAHLGLAGIGWSLVLPVVMVGVGAISGRDGIAFTGLPLSGAIAAMLSGGDAQRAVVLAALGQVVTVWVGAGVFLPWSDMRTVADAVGLERGTLAAANRLPVLAGIAVTTLLSMLLLARC